MQRKQYVQDFIAHTRRNIFLTGKAGTGKTTLLHYIREHTYKSCIIAAPTGIAALNAGGTTLHSLFQLPIGSFIPDSTSGAGAPGDRRGEYASCRHARSRGSGPEKCAP